MTEKEVLYRLYAEVPAHASATFRLEKHVCIRSPYGWRRANSNTVRPRDIGTLGSFRRGSLYYFHIWLVTKPVNYHIAMEEFRAEIQKHLKEKIAKQEARAKELQKEIFENNMRLYSTSKYRAQEVASDEHE